MQHIRAGSQGYLRRMKEYGQVVMKLSLNLENNLNNSWNQEITIHKNVKGGE
jgi:hypothetical protein